MSAILLPIMTCVYFTAPLVRVLSFFVAGSAAIPHYYVAMDGIHKCVA